MNLVRYYTFKRGNCIMNVQNQLTEITLPDIYNRENKNCYYDTYRKKLIEITPEETVRQKIAKLFELKYGVPKEMISLEVPMSHYVEKASGRADIVIHAFDQASNEIYPLTVIECKNEEVFLTDAVVEQGIRYCDTLGGKYLVLTNGIEIMFSVYDEESENYVFIDEILSYKKMLNNNFSLPQQHTKEFLRFTMDELQQQQLLEEYNDADTWIFGKETNEQLRTFAVNFYQALLDTKHTLPKVKNNVFEIIEDIGQRYMDYSNAGGGHYNGIYRAFLVKDRFNETQIVSLSIFGTDPDFRGENRNSYTSLVVAIDRFKTSHNSLQYNVDRFTRFLPNKKIRFIHNGQISNHKNTEILSAISAIGNNLSVASNVISLGEIDSDRILYLDNPDVAQMIYNFIEYALIREEVRNNSKRISHI